jgi:tetratricopeptide (TPR) repeat protein
MSMKDQIEDFADQLGRYLVRIGFTQQELANKIGMHRNTIVKWMNRTSWPTSRGQVLRVADELSLSKQERKAFIQAAGFSLEHWPTEVWTVPQQRDMFFTGRDDVIQSLRELLVPGTTTALTQAISGLGGIGKTHTAVEYAYRFHQDYEAVLWLQADSWEVLVSACVMLADELGLPEQKETDKVVAEVQRWLRKHPHWLLILDGVEDPQEILTKFVPTGHRGSILITTRVHDVEPLAQTQVLLTMSEQEGVLFLLRRTKRIATRADLEQVKPEDYHEARQIWQLVDGLPLALDQAGAYILETSSSFSTYREQYTHRRAELLHQRGKRFIGHKASVDTTFLLAFERVKVLNPLAADILHVCSLLHSEGIPEELFQEGAERLGPRIATGSDGWNLAIGVLQDYSLVQRNADARTLTVHRLVQAVLQDILSDEEREKWVARATLAMSNIFPEVEFATWNQCERCLPHAMACINMIEQYKGHLPPLYADPLFYRVGQYLYERSSRYSEVEFLCKRALPTLERLLEPEHFHIIDLLSYLAAAYKGQGRYEQTEPLLQRVLAVRERQLGPEHPKTAASLNNLAELYHSWGKYEQAEPLYKRALAIQEQLGPGHPDTAAVLNNLAEFYREQGEYEQAEPLYQRALAIREQHLEPEHPATAESLNNLAGLYHAQGKYEQAEPLYQRALAIRERQLAPEHLGTATTLNNLAVLYQAQGRYEQAEPLYQRALAIQEQQLGSEQVGTAFSLLNLGDLYCAQGIYEQAEPLLQRAFTIMEKTLGIEHPDTVNSFKYLLELYQAQGKEEKVEALYVHTLATSLNKQANRYYDQGKYEQAEPLYRRVLAIRAKILGTEHLDTAGSLADLEALYYAQGKYEQAEPLCKRALAIQEQQLGPEHPTTVRSLDNLAALYQAQGKYEQAEPLYQRALAIRERQWGPEHPNTAVILNNLATLYDERKMYEQAEPLYKRVLAIQEKLGSEHFHMAITLNNLALLYAERGKYAEALPLYVRALEVQEKLLGAEHPIAIATTLDNLGTLYDHLDMNELAEQHYQRALMIYERTLGIGHPDTVICLTNLAGLYQKQGRFTEAEQLYQRILTVREQSLGSSHPKTIETRKRYATLLQAMGRQDEAALLEESQSEQRKTDEEQEPNQGK